LEITHNIIDFYFPTKIIKVHDEDKPFITGKNKSLISKRNKAYKSGKYILFKTILNQIVSEIRLSKRKFYEEKILPTYRQNPKIWWKNINDIVGKKKNTTPMLLGPISELPMNNKQTADHINSFFSSLTNDFLEVRGDWPARGELDPLPSIPDENVAKRLSDLTVGKAAGPYDPYIKLIKMLAKYFAIPLADIYNESFMSRIFPQILHNLRVSEDYALFEC
jgi:DNA-binding XRE family transcriptional regulator